jgi:hypothetical protein
MPVAQLPPGNAADTAPAAFSDALEVGSFFF